jgi:hypothetical protein
MTLRGMLLIRFRSRSAWIMNRMVLRGSQTGKQEWWRYSMYNITRGDAKGECLVFIHVEGKRVVKEVVKG